MTGCECRRNELRAKDIMEVSDCSWPHAKFSMPIVQLIRSHCITTTSHYLMTRTFPDRFVFYNSFTENWILKWWWHNFHQCTHFWKSRRRKLVLGGQDCETLLLLLLHMHVCNAVEIIFKCGWCQCCRLDFQDQVPLCVRHLAVCWSILVWVIPWRWRTGQGWSWLLKRNLV